MFLHLMNYNPLLQKLKLLHKHLYLTIINIPSRRMTKRAIRISQSKALSLVADDTAPPIRGDRYGEAFPTATSLDAEQDRENIPKTSAMPHESFPRVTSLS
ncbi:hypothetical protein Tco_0130361, partial [Tanacetum coccineum]